MRLRVLGRLVFPAGKRYWLVALGGGEGVGPALFNQSRSGVFVELCEISVARTAGQPQEMLDSYSNVVAPIADWATVREYRIRGSRSRPNSGDVVR